MVFSSQLAHDLSLRIEDPARAKSAPIELPVTADPSREASSSRSLRPRCHRASSSALSTASGVLTIGPDRNSTCSRRSPEAGPWLQSISLPWSSVAKTSCTLTDRTVSASTRWRNSLPMKNHENLTGSLPNQTPCRSRSHERRGSGSGHHRHLSVWR